MSTDHTLSPYLQLVRLTEHPGARIGRLPLSELAPAERHVAVLLDFAEKLDIANRGWGESLQILLAEQSSAWWERVLASLHVTGLERLVRSARFAVHLLGINLDVAEDERRQQLDVIEPRRMRAAYRVWRTVEHGWIEAGILDYAARSGLLPTDPHCDGADR